MVGFNQWYAPHPPLLIMTDRFQEVKFKQARNEKEKYWFLCFVFFFFVGGGVISVFGEIDH